MIVKRKRTGKVLRCKGNCAVSEYVFIINSKKYQIKLTPDLEVKLDILGSCYEK